MSPIATGLGSFMGHGTETTWGTAVAQAAGNYNRFVNQTFISQADQTDGDRSLGLAFTAGKRIYRRRSEGEIVLDFKYQGFDRFLLHLFGTGSVTTTVLAGVDAGAFKHEYILKTARRPGMTINWNLEIFKLVMAGLKVNKGSFSMGVGVLQATFGGVAKAFAGPPGSVDVPASYLEDVAGIMPVQSIESGSPGTIGTANNGFSLRVGTAGTFASPATYCALEPATIDIEAPINAQRVCLGDPNITEPVLSGKFDVSGSFSRELVDNAFLEFFRAGNAVYLRHQYDGPGPIIPGGAQIYQMIFDIPYAKISQAGVSVDGAGPLVEQIPWYIDPATQAGADAIKITVFNKLSAVS